MLYQLSYTRTTLIKPQPAPRVKGSDQPPTRPCEHARMTPLLPRKPKRLGCNTVTNTPEDDSGPMDAAPAAKRKPSKGEEALNAVLDLNEWFAGTRNLDEILQDTAERIAKAMKVKACGIRLLNEETGEMVIRAVYNLSDAYLNKGPVVLGENPIDTAAMAGETVFIENAATDPRVRYGRQAEEEGLVSGLCVPMTYRGQTVGVIRVYSGRRHRFSREEEALLRSAGSQSAAGIIEARLVEQHRETERYTRQMHYAGEIQRRMIPSSAPDHKFVDFGCVYDPSLELGGDFYDFIDLGGDGNIGFSIADVVGKGIPAALMMASVRSALRAHAPSRADIRRIISRVNQHMCRDTLPSEFVTLFYGVFHADRRRLTYINAGHDPPLLLRGDTLRELDTGGLVIGVVPDAEHSEDTVDLQPDDVIVFYTDGVVDALNYEDEAFGRQRLRESISKYRDCPAPELAEQIKWDTRRFAGLAQQNDDITIVVAKVR